MLLPAAAAGFVTAQFALGQLLESGRLGKRDPSTAHRWYERAAAQGDLAAAGKVRQLDAEAAELDAGLAFRRRVAAA